VTLQLDVPPADGAPGSSAERGRRRTSMLVGLVLVAVGLSLVSWVGWQLWGTTWVGHRTQREVVSQLERQWESGHDEVRTEHGLAGAVVKVPRFGPDYAVPVLEGTSQEVLASGYGHFAGSALPGQVGNFALAAHRITHGEPLRGMPELEVGDRIVVETRTTTYTYRLTTGGDDLTVPFTARWVTATQPVNPDAGGPTPQTGPDARIITLTTCSELFHTDNRLIAFGTLVKAEPRT
jgi:sortase A